jgi:hypothetical protein
MGQAAPVLFVSVPEKTGIAADVIPMKMGIHV